MNADDLARLLKGANVTIIIQGGTGNTMYTAPVQNNTKNNHAARRAPRCKICGRSGGADLYSGIKIPDDLSVVGFDNISESKYMGLTTVDQFISEMGYVATQMLIKLINGEQIESQTFRMQTSLVIRSSCQKLLRKNKRMVQLAA